MKSRIKKSTAIALGAAAAAAGVASRANAQIFVSGSETPTITYVLAINDNGFGVYTPNDFAVYAIDGQVASTGSGDLMVATSVTEGTDGGMLGYGVAISNAVTLNDDIQNGSLNNLNQPGLVATIPPFYQVLPTITTKASDLLPVTAGFSTGTGDTATSVGGEQIQIGTPPPGPTLFKANGAPNGTTSTIPIFGIGQVGGSMGGDFFNSVPAASGYQYGNHSNNGSGVGPASGNYIFSGPQLAVNPNSNGNLYLTGLLVAEGTYTTGTKPILSDTPTTNIYLQNVLYAAANEAYTGGGYTPTSATPALFGETLGVSGVPEPASAGLIGVGAMGLLARRRRRELGRL